MSKEVKRYDPYGYDGLSALMCESELGDYVSHEDYEAVLAENERLQMQLVACGVVALANTPESAAEARAMHPDYMSGSCQDVMRVVDKEMALRAERDRLREALEQAAQSLESISKLAGRDEFMQDMLDVRGFANSRATVARAALQGEQP